MSKRKPEFQLDRDKYGEAVKGTEIHQNELASESDRIWSQAEISERKIYKAKRLVRPGDPLGNRKTGVGKFKLFGSLIVKPKNTKKVIIPQPPPKVEKQNSSQIIEEKKSIFTPPPQKDETKNPKSTEIKLKSTTQTLFNKNSKVKSAPDEKVKEKKLEIQEPKKSFFECSTDPTKSVFVNKPDAENTKNLVSVFGSKPSKEKKLEIKEGSPVKKATNLFEPKKKGSNQKNTEEKSTLFDKTTDKATKKKSSLFGLTTKPNLSNYSIFGGQKTSSSTGLFGQTPPVDKNEEKIKKIPEPEKKVEEKQPKESVIFKPKTGTTSLFTSKTDEIKPINIQPIEIKPKLSSGKAINIFGKTTDEKIEAPNKVNIFASSSTSSQSGCKYQYATQKWFNADDIALFGQSKTSKNVENKGEKKDEKKENEEKPKVKSLFGSTTTTTKKDGIFGVNTTGKGIFGGTSTLFGGPSLFSGVKTNSNPELNKNSFINSGKAANEKEIEEEEKEKEKEDSKPSFVAISKDPYNKIFNKQVEKFRTKKGDKGNGHLSIETGDLKGKKFVLFNFRNPIGKTLFTGQIVSFCKIMSALDKPGKIQIKATVLEKDIKSGKLVPMPTLISFNRTDDLKDFKIQWEAAKKFLEN